MSGDTGCPVIDYLLYKGQKIMFSLRIQTKWPIIINEVFYSLIGRGRISNTRLHRCPFSRMLTVDAEIRICVRRHVWEHAERFSFLPNRNWLRKPTPAKLLLHVAEFPFLSAIASFTGEIEYSSRVNHSLPNTVCLSVCTVCTCMFCTSFCKHLIIHLMSFV